MECERGLAGRRNLTPLRLNEKAGKNFWLKICNNKTLTIFGFMFAAASEIIIHFYQSRTSRSVGVFVIFLSIGKCLGTWPHFRGRTTNGKLLRLLGPPVPVHHIIIREEEAQNPILSAFNCSLTITIGVGNTSCYVNIFPAANYGRPPRLRLSHARAATQTTGTHFSILPVIYSPAI